VFVVAGREKGGARQDLHSLEEFLHGLVQGIEALPLFSLDGGLLLSPALLPVV
jgi:hypothetical protein